MRSWTAFFLMAVIGLGCARKPEREAPEQRSGRPPVDRTQPAPDSGAGTAAGSELAASEATGPEPADRETPAAETEATAHETPGTDERELVDETTEDTAPPEAAFSLAKSPMENADGTLDGSQTGQQSETVTDDRDFDGLNDEDEVKLGTNPDDPDTDGDALLDGWEVKGVDGTKLKDLGANPLRKDIFVEMDFMKRAGATLAPPQAVLDELVAVFDNAKLGSTGGLKDGIALHLDLDDEIPHESVMTVFGFYIAKGNHFDVAKRGRCFHYVIWADGFQDAKGNLISGQSMGIPDDSFIVSLGPWEADTGGDDAEKTGTFMHELGHNLGLRHGGGENLNYKPNHLSVMSYAWQMTGVKKGATSFAWTYQWRELGALDETSLDEDQGLGLLPALAGWNTTWFDKLGNQLTGPADGPLNWDGEGPTGGTTHVDLNRDGGEGPLQKTPNEWQSLVFKGGMIGSGVPADELKKESLRPPPDVDFETLLEPDVQRTRKVLGFR